MRASRFGESALLLLDVVDVLGAHGIDYAVVGALAASIHGAVRASLDADAVLSADPREANRIQALLERAGLQVELSRGDSGDPIAAMIRASDVHGNRVVPVAFQGGQGKFAGREDFIAMKAYAIEAAGTKLDTESLRQIASGYGRETAATVEKLLGETWR